MNNVVLQLAAAGKVYQIEAGRSGIFRAKKGGQVDLTPEKLSFMARNFDPGEDHKILVGHKLETDTPDYGDVVSLEYNAARDRLLAGAKPTELLVERNRKEGFRRVSMELDRREDGNFLFRNLAFLAAHRPAIHGLEPVTLARREVLVCAADENLTDLQLADLSLRGDFTAANPEFEFSRSETHERVRAYMLAHPDVRYAQALEAVGQEERERISFADADPDSVELHLAAQKEIDKEKAKGNAITYLEGARRAALARSARSEGLG